jgi:hypothetical protein
MHLAMRAVEGDTVRRSGFGRQRGEEPGEHALLAPARLAMIHRLGRPLLRRAIGPAQSVLDEVHAAAQHPTLIHTWYAAHVVGQPRLDLGKLLFAEPEQMAHEALAEQTFSLKHRRKLL